MSKFKIFSTLMEKGGQFLARNPRLASKIDAAKDLAAKYPKATKLLAVAGPLGIGSLVGDGTATNYGANIFEIMDKLTKSNKVGELPGDDISTMIKVGIDQIQLEDELHSATDTSDPNYNAIYEDLVSDVAILTAFNQAAGAFGLSIDGLVAPPRKTAQGQNMNVPGTAMGAPPPPGMPGSYMPQQQYQSQMNSYQQVSPYDGSGYVQQPQTPVTAEGGQDDFVAMLNVMQEVQSKMKRLQSMLNLRDTSELIEALSLMKYLASMTREQLDVIRKLKD